jgi:hypothetical protein
VILLLTTLAACAAPASDYGSECGEIISVSTRYTADDEGEEVIVGEPCYASDPQDGSLDVTACCPDDYTFLAMGGDADTVLCEEDC